MQEGYFKWQHLYNPPALLLPNLMTACAFNAAQILIEHCGHYVGNKHFFKDFLSPVNYEKFGDFRDRTGQMTRLIIMAKW